MRTPLTELEKQYGITRKTLAKWRDQGIDIYNPEKVLQKKNCHNQCDISETEDFSADDLADYKARKFIAETKIKETMLAYEKLELEKAQGKVIELLSAQQAFAKIGAVVKSMLLRLEQELPSLVCGLAEPEIAKIIGDKTKQLLKQLSDQDGLWK